MGPDLTPIDVFVASPDDCAKERNAVGRVVAEINRTIGEREGWFCRVRRWETDARPGLGRAQQLILDQVGVYDILVGIMAKRFGTPTTKAGSGTEEEFDSAYTAHRRRKHKPEIMFYFRVVTLRSPTKSEVEQYQKVKAFEQKVHGKALSWTYPAINAFADTHRPHLVDAARAAFAKRKADGRMGVKAIKTTAPKASTKPAPPKRPKVTVPTAKSSTAPATHKQAASLKKVASQGTKLSVPTVRRSYTASDKRK